MKWFDNIKKRISDNKSKKVAEKQREEERIRTEERLIEEEIQNKKDAEDFKSYFLIAINYIYNNYTTCEINVPKDNFLVISCDGLVIKNDYYYQQKKKFEFKITLNNTFTKPTFDVYIMCDCKKYNYESSGLSYTQFKNFILSSVYSYYKMKSSSSKSSSSKSNYGDGDSFSESFNSNTYKTKPKSNESIEIANKRRRYDLLVNTLKSHEKELKDILSWEKTNHGKKHDNKEVTLNLIINIKDKMDTMNKIYHFDSIK